MRGRYPCGGMHRREFLRATAVPLPGAVGPPAQEPKGRADPAASSDLLGVPGPYPGRVIEVRNPALKRGGRKDRAADAGDPQPGARLL